MMESPPTVSPQRVTLTCASKRSTHCTNLAVARACRPLRLTMRISRACAPAMTGGGGQSSSSRRSVVSLIFPVSTLLATVMYLRPASRASITAWSRSALSRKRRQLDQHRQVDAADHLDAAAVHHRDREVRRRAAEHVGEQHDAAAVLNARHRAEDVGAALLHVVFGADRDRFESRLRTDDVFERGAKTSGELAVSDQDHSNHQQFHRLRAPPPRQRTVSTLRRAHFCAVRRNVQAKFAKRTISLRAPTGVKAP